MRLVKPASNFALGKIQTADRKLRFWGLKGGILLILAAPIGLGVGLLDPGTGFVVGAVLAGSGFVLVMIGVSFWLEAGNTRKGLEGEQSVASELSYLSDEFLLLNDVMLPGERGNIDHVLIGPTGVFVFETKNYSGKYVCHGDRWFFQGKWQKYDVKSVSVQAKNNASFLGGLLRVRVYGPCEPSHSLHSPLCPTMAASSDGSSVERWNGPDFCLGPETGIRDHFRLC